MYLYFKDVVVSLLICQPLFSCYLPFLLNISPDNPPISCTPPQPATYGTHTSRRHRRDDLETAHTSREWRGRQIHPLFTHKELFFHPGPFSRLFAHHHWRRSGGFGRGSKSGQTEPKQLGSAGGAKPGSRHGNFEPKLRGHSRWHLLSARIAAYRVVYSRQGAHLQHCSGGRS